MRYLPLFLIFVLLFGCAGPVPQAPPAKNVSQNEIPPMVVKINDSGPEVPPPAQPPPEQPPSQPQPPATPSLPSKEISYEAGGWTIYGDLYEAKNKNNPTKAVILAHMLGHDRKSYPPSFIERIHNELPDAMILAIDLRGHGKSKSLGTYQDFSADEFKNMKLDIIEAKKYFQRYHPTVKQYYAVGASIGSTAAILAGAQEKQINKVAMISPGLSYKDVEIESAVDDYPNPLFVCAGSGDTYSASSAQTIQDWAGASQSDIKIYQGTSAHGTDLFEATEIYSVTLEDDIVEFLK
jgi:pimeloyl-ACP methyl ester carboxylesterase